MEQEYHPYLFFLFKHIIKKRGDKFNVCQEGGDHLTIYDKE